MVATTSQINYETFKMFLLFVVPPWAVYLDTGFSRVFWLNVLLTLIGFYPGVMHAVFVFLKHLK
jgi:uncharacterized membrane protein YqaE (UPF0057 family)